jgi:hypothetical protein
MSKILKYRCGKCYKLHTFRIDAMTCCAPEPLPVWRDNVDLKNQSPSQTWNEFDKNWFMKALRGQIK